MMRRKARPNLSTSLGDKVAVETNGGVTTPSSLQQNNYHRQRELEWQFYHGGNSTTGQVTASEGEWQLSKKGHKGAQSIV